jgi:tetraacyldisaccharide 4'-kinase
MEALRGQRVAAFCGIGNPAGFRHTIENFGCQIAGFREFPDHWRYTTRDADALADWATKLSVSAVLCTRKDLVKLSADRLGSLPLWAVQIQIEFLTGGDGLKERLEALKALPNN